MNIALKSVTAVQPHFGRALTADEWQGYRQAIRDGKQALDIKHLGLIAPVRSLPGDHDTGIGSLTGAKPFFQFATNLGFDMVQIDPEGKTKYVDPSPYAGTVFSINPLYINLAPLAKEPEWAGILSQDTFERIQRENPNQGRNQVAYEYIFNAQQQALDEAYANFRRKTTQVDSLPAAEKKAIQQLSQAFDSYQAKNRQWLEADALYEVLSTVYGNDYWPHWAGPDSELDKQLLSPSDAGQAQKAQARIQSLKAQYPEVFEGYQFAQFIASQQKASFKEFAHRTGFKVMADRQIGLSDRDVWANQAYFLKGWSMGVPPDYFSKNGQAWGFPVWDPEKLFHQDGSLAPGGVLLKALFEKIFEENPGGVRIDHIIGLIDPWVYPAGQSAKSGGRLFSSPDHSALGKYALVPATALNWDVKRRIDQDAQIPPEDKASAWQASEDRVRKEALDDAAVNRYARILDHIVLAAARDKGVPQDAIICEDLGTLTNPVKKVMEKKGLSGIRVSQFVNPHDPSDINRVSQTGPRHWVTTGTHDNEPTLVWSRKRVAHQNKHETYLHAKNLADDLVKADQGEKDRRIHQWMQDALALTQAKFAEVFASPARQIQLFFSDLLGMEEVYNRPGNHQHPSWRLRIPQNYEDLYFENLKAGKALNLPQTMLDALHAKPEIAARNPDLMARLRHYAEILKK